MFQRGIFLLACFALALQESRADAHSEHQGISVIGECLVRVAQDRAGVSIGSHAQASSAKEAAEKTLKAHEKIKQEVRALNLPDFESSTQGYTVDRDCSYDNGKQHCSGYRAVLTTRFETSDIPRIGDVVAVATTLGAEEVSSLFTFISSGKVKEAREECLSRATENATSKAKKIALGAGVTLGKLRSVTEHTGFFPQASSGEFRATAMMATSESSIAPPSIDTKPEEIRVEVLARYDIIAR